MTSVFPSSGISHDISCTEEHFTDSRNPPSDASLPSRRLRCGVAGDLAARGGPLVAPCLGVSRQGDLDQGVLPADRLGSVATSNRHEVGVVSVIMGGK